MKEINDTQRKIDEARFNSNLFRVVQGTGIIVGVIGLLLGPLWTLIIQPNLTQLNNRVEKVEAQLFEMQKQQTGLDKNLAILVEKMGGMESNIQDIKNTLKGR
jgi:ABC-type lipoprotein release transport system permease subunit